MKKSILIILSIISTITLNSKDDIDYGLTFQTINVNQEQRTSLDLTANKPINLPNGFSLEFDLMLHSLEQSYGYIFRIIDNNNLSLDLITNTKLQEINLILNGKEQILSSIKYDKNIIANDKWLKIKIHIYCDNIICSIDSKTQKMPYSLESMKNIQIFFGKNGHPQFYTSDVPFMTIKNLVIKDHDSKVVRDWKMSKHIKDGVLDEQKRVKANVLNGKWVIDQYARWDKITSIPSSDLNAQIAFDSKLNKLFVATNDSLIIYSIDKRHKQSIHVTKGKIFKSGGSQLIYDAKNERLLSYSVLYNNFISFDFELNEWSSDQIEQGFPSLQQHNRLIDTLSNQLILFGGYGVHTYSAKLYTHSLSGGEWQTKDLSSQITPRYLSSMGYLEKNKLLVFGGYGGVSGKQEGYTTNLYDLWEIDFENYECKKLAQFKNPDDRHFAVSSSMVIDKENKQLFSLAYNNDRFNSFVQLMSFNWKTSTMKPLADSIPYNFLDIESFCDLVMTNGTLYAILLQGKSSDKYNIEIYSLKYPPIEDEIYQDEIVFDTHSFLSKKLIFISLVSLFGLSFFILIVWIKRKRKKNILNYSASINSAQVETKAKRITSTINLLGGFQVFDKEGDNITEEFSTIIKHLFLYILLNTVNEGKRITSEKINETIWFGMEKTSASNNRSVNIKKLRTLLKKVGDIEIINKNSYWHVIIGETVSCDYLKIIDLLETENGTVVVDKNLLESILNIASEGVLLPNINEEWLDIIKSEFSNLIFDFFTRTMSQPEIKEDLKLLLKICDLLLLHDNIDENIVKIKCQTLYKLGQKGLSKQCYERFLLEYKKVLDAIPDFTYDDILKESY